MNPKTLLALSLLSTALFLTGCNRPGESEATKAQPHSEEQAAHPGEEGEHREGAVEFPLEAQKQAKLAAETVETRPVAEVFVATGEFEANADRLAHVKPVVAGRVMSVARSVGDRVGAGDTLAVIQSGELGDAQAAYLEAQSNVTVAQEAVERQRRLFADDLTARKEVVAAENALRIARIAVEKARHRLQALGMSSERIRTLARTHELDTTIPLRAPLSGVITSRHLTLGEPVEPNSPEPAFVIIDTRELWVNANLYEKDLASVRVGQAADVSTPAYPGRTFRGKVSLISPVLDPETRTAKARIDVANPDGLLKPEMFANAAIRTSTRRSLAIPAKAVLQDKGETFVFIRTGESTFEKRDVVVGPTSGGLVPVRSGLVAGERVVTEGALTLKAELLKESFGEHHH